MLHGPKSTQRRAARLRRTLSLPEVLLWRELRHRPVKLKFRRQHPAGRYVLDFFCASLNLAVEIDGISHDMGTNPQHDLARDVWLAQQGVTILRVPARVVLADPAQVADLIVRFAQAL